MRRLKHEQQDKRIDGAFLQETFFLDTVDQLRDYAVIDIGSVNAARKKKRGASIALRNAITPHIEEIERKKGNLTRVKIRKIAVAPWGPSVSCHAIGVYVPKNPAELEEERFGLFDPVAKIPFEEEFIKGGDFDAHMSAVREPRASFNGQPKPSEPLGPFFLSAVTTISTEII